MTNFNYTQPFVIVGALVVRDGKILLIQENHEPDKGTWNLTAGKLDFGESPIDAAKREVFEESGLTFTPTGMMSIHSVHRFDVRSGISQGGEVHPIRIIFVGDVAGEVSLEHGDPVDGVAEISGYRWLAPEEILALPDSELRYHDIKTLVRDWQAGAIYPLTAIAHIEQH